MKKSQQTKCLEETIDLVTTENWDLKDRVRKLETELSRALEQLKGARELQQRLQSSGNEELRRAWDKVNIAEKEQERIQNNYEHAQQTIRQLNANMELAKKEVEKHSKAHIAEEHFARKLVELCNENNRLRADICTLKEQEKAACEIMNAKLESVPEYKAYQTQVTRLLDQIRTYDCQKAMVTVGNEEIPECGNCISCQLKQTKKILEQTAENLAKRNSEFNELSKRLKDIEESHEENRRLLQSLQNQSDLRRQLLMSAMGAFEQISRSWMWEVKGIAAKELDAIIKELKEKSMPESLLL